MHRRTALKNMTLAAGGLLLLPNWANAWTKASLPAGPALLSLEQQALLTEVIDALIPASDTPGARALEVPAFVQTMVADCYEPPVQQQFVAGLAGFDELAHARFGKSFAACSPAERTDVLLAFEATTDTTRKAFYSLLKQLTIQGYTTSEYVMTGYYKYTMIPGHYYGCVPVATR
ncbi:gluconate 2-dehydrogenase subunit 3 family protein [Rudanella paleaurantiibacter]|uniref:Gluconate 2-dehydrogenase subunit 3 family protein n=1 Tax=Rudanella paleaurantiibacter TaxID=2614655 RepID=A0A7J5TV78_9BACT|nr:gluconate 2-dehydrogenase subunit 3 family protein [Rudanella paleaurantiibacter]KAB7727977.1 gluconate 2-dehydrogenase subunit 3 family protein [Rudanella paleaurantiibacter]